jgi:GT2 family glycosyltransferase
MRQIRWPLSDHPSVSIVIPTTGRARLLAPCLRSLRALTQYEPLEIVLVDSGQGTAAGIAAAEVGGIPHRVVPYGGSFNFSRACNLGLKVAEGKHVLFMNDDVEARHPDWLKLLVEYAELPGMGAVGPRLLWPEHLVQSCGIGLVRIHAGVGGPREIFQGLEADSTGPDDLLTIAHETTAVTGACMLVTRAALDLIGMWDERFPLNYGDVDLCLRAWNAGLRVVVIPHVVLGHEESASRPQYENPDQLRVFDARWGISSPDRDRLNHPTHLTGHEFGLTLTNEGF